MIWVRKLNAALNRRCVNVPVTVVCAVAFVIGGVVVAGRTEGVSMLGSLALVYAYMQLFIVPAPRRGSYELPVAPTRADDPVVALTDLRRERNRLDKPIRRHEAG